MDGIHDCGGWTVKCGRAIALNSGRVKMFTPLMQSSANCYQNSLVYGSVSRAELS